MRFISILLSTALIVTQANAAEPVAATSTEAAPQPTFSFSQATEIIYLCFNFVRTNKYGGTSQCMDMFLKLKSWTRTDRYADQAEVLSAIQYATSINELYVPIFAFMANLDQFDEAQKLEGATVLRLTLEKMAGTQVKFENDDHAYAMTHFLVDGLISLSLNNVDSVGNIEFLNLLASQSQSESVRISYDTAIEQRVRFMVDYASAPQIKKMSMEQKMDYLGPFKMREFKRELAKASQPLHFSDGVPSPLHKGWKGAAREMTVDRPLQKVLEGLSQNIGNEILDVEVVQLENGTQKIAIQRLNEIGGWSEAVLKRMGIEMSPKPKDVNKSACESLMSPAPAVVPAPVRDR